MEKICLPRIWEDEHWRHVQADVCTVAADLIPMVQSGACTVGDLKDAIADFHDCHALALLHQLACEFSDRGHTPNTIRDQLLAWDVTDAMT